MQPLVTIENISDQAKKKKRYLLPNTGQHNPRPPLTTKVLSTGEHLFPFLEQLSSSKILVVDLETRGLLPYLPVQTIDQDGPDSPESVELVGIGLAGDTGALYFSWKDGDKAGKKMLCSLLRTHPCLVAHNIPFDGSWIYRLLGDTHPHWGYDTLSLVRYLASEGYPGDSAGLKKVMTEYLGWQNTNEKHKDEWLVRRGYINCQKGNGDLNTEEGRLSRWESGNIGPDNSQMWRCPPDILREYCHLDAEATYLLLTKVIGPILKRFRRFNSLFRNEIVPHIEEHIRQFFTGIPLDIEAFQARDIHLRAQIQEVTSGFLNHPEVSAVLPQIEEKLQKEELGSEPVKYKKCSITDPGPEKLNKNGTVNQQWKKKSDRYSNHSCEVECISKNWINWKEKEKKITEVPLFNLASGDHVRTLMYDHLGFEPKVFTDKSIEGCFGSPRLPSRPLTALELGMLTPATNNIALHAMGELGAQLNHLADIRKELTAFIEPYPRFAEFDQKIHPNFSIPGAKTGRIAAYKPNITQLPKAQAVMSMFRAEVGRVFVDADMVSLEPRVAAEFSRDKNMLFLYGRESRPNDIYLFVGSQVPGKMGEKIRAAGYDPYNPTKEGISAAKKLCKKERNTAKTICLAAVYGAGAPRLHRTFIEQNIAISFPEVEGVYNTYWKIFAGVKELRYRLTRRWEENGYFLVNGLGRPLAIEPEFGRKDILNRFVQGTGVDLLICIGNLLAKRLNAAGLDWRPVIWNWHDAITIDVPEPEVEAALECFRQAEKDLDEKLHKLLLLPSNYGTPMIQFPWEPMTGKTLADVKQPED